MRLTYTEAPALEAVPICSCGSLGQHFPISRRLKHVMALTLASDALSRQAVLALRSAAGRLCPQQAAEAPGHQNVEDAIGVL